MMCKAMRLGELIQVDNVEKKRGLRHSSTGNPLRGSVANAGYKNEVLRRPERTGSKLREGHPRSRNTSSTKSGRKVKLMIAFSDVSVVKNWLPTQKAQEMRV